MPWENRRHDRFNYKKCLRWFWVGLILVLMFFDVLISLFTLWFLDPLLDTVRGLWIANKLFSLFLIFAMCFEKKYSLLRCCAPVTIWLSLCIFPWLGMWEKLATNSLVASHIFVLFCSFCLFYNTVPGRATASSGVSKLIRSYCCCEEPAVFISYPAMIYTLVSMIYQPLYGLFMFSTRSRMN